MKIGAHILHVSDFYLRLFFRNGQRINKFDCIPQIEALKSIVN